MLSLTGLIWLPVVGLFGIVKVGSPIFRVDVNGNVLAAGSKSTVVKAGEFGQRKLYAVEAPDVRFSDEGLARLKNGALG